MLQSGSCPSSAIVLMSSRARSASSPARWRSWTSSGTDSSASAAATVSERSSWIGRGASWIGSMRRARVLASASSRIARRPGSTSSSSPGPRRPRRTVSAAANGTAPASEATATSRSRVTANEAGRSPLRSTIAPTRTPSAKTIAAGPSQGARKPAVRRRSVATCGCGERRRASASGIAASKAGVRSQPVAISSSSASSSESESEPPGERSGPAARSSAAIAFVPVSRARPRTCSRLPRTVLISPLWAMSRNGWARPQTGCVFVA